MLCNIMRFISRFSQFFKPVAITGVLILIKACREAIIEGSTVKDVIKSTLKYTVGAVLCATVDQIASKLIEMRDIQNEKFLPNPPIVVPEFVQEN